MERYAVVENGVVVNVCLATPEYAAECGWIYIDVYGVSAGWLYQDGQFVPPPEPEPTPEPDPQPAP